jgi:hypothetical protein
MDPHVFPDTLIYEVHYLPLAMSYPTGKWIEANTNDFYNRPTSGSMSVQDPTSSLLSSLPMGIPITSQLISEVSQAAATNPPLANLLQLALTGTASPDQRQTLVLLIQSLPAANISISTHGSDSASSSNHDNSTSHTPAPIYATREWDLVFEFRDLPSEKWIFPRGYVVCTRQAEPPSPYYVGKCTITTVIPFDRTSWVPVSDSKPSTPPERMEFHLGRTPNAVWDTLERWSNTMKKDSQAYLDSLVRNRVIWYEYTVLTTALQPKPKRAYLKYRLPEGAQLTQIKNVSFLYMFMYRQKHDMSSFRQQQPHLPRSSLDPTDQSTLDLDRSDLHKQASQPHQHLRHLLERQPSVAANHSSPKIKHKSLHPAIPRHSVEQRSRLRVSPAARWMYPYWLMAVCPTFLFDKDTLIDKKK